MVKSYNKYCRFKNKETSKSGPLNYLISRFVHNVVRKQDYEQQKLTCSQQNVQSLLMCSKYHLWKCRMRILDVHQLILSISSTLFRHKSVFKSLYYNRIEVLSPCKSSHEIYLNSRIPFKCKKHFSSA